MNEFPTMPDGEKMLRINEVAKLLRMSDKTVRRMIDSEKLPTKKLGGIHLIRWSDVQKLVRQSA